MRRYASVLRLRENAIEKYETYHRNVWPEITRAAENAGLRNYSIFRYGPWLFSYCELPDDVSPEAFAERLAAVPEKARWEELMRPLQEPLPESQGETWWVPMKELFHLDGIAGAR